MANTIVNRDISGLRLVRRRHPSRWVAAFIALLIMLTIGDILITSPQWKWPLVAEYLFAPEILKGVMRTIQLTAIAFVISIVVGLIVALMRLSDNPVLKWFAIAYLWFNRAIPVLVTLLFIFFLAALLPRISIGIPIIGPQFISWSTNDLISKFTAAIIGLVLIESAYKAEIIRSGLLSVSKGQYESAMSLGMTRSTLMRRIILPQAIRVMVPPMGNQFITLFKNTSIVSVIGYSELLTTVQLIYTKTYQTIPLLTVACIWYLSLASIAMLAQQKLEDHFSKGYADLAGKKKYFRRFALLTSRGRVAP